jgi:hypothetical protein
LIKRFLFLALLVIATSAKSETAIFIDQNHNVLGSCEESGFEYDFISDTMTLHCSPNTIILYGTRGAVVNLPGVVAFKTTALSIDSAASGAITLARSIGLKGILIASLTVTGPCMLASSQVSFANGVGLASVSIQAMPGVTAGTCNVGIASVTAGAVGNPTQLTVTVGQLPICRP